MTTTSLSIMHQVPAPTLSTPSTMHSSLAPTPHDLRASIPVRTSSIRTKTTIVVSVSPPTTTTVTASGPSNSLQPPRPTSPCSSVHSTFSVSGSLDHRTMTRPSAQASLKPRPVHTRSSSLDTVSKQPHSSTSNSPVTTTTPTTTTTTPAPTPTTTTTASNERTAFLTSAPVRSRVQITSPRFKNMHSHSHSSSSGGGAKFSPGSSVTSLPSSLRCCPLSMGVCCVLGSGHGTTTMTGGRCGALNLNKRRWSNDSTRGLHGAAPLLLWHALEKSEDENEDALSGTTIHDDDSNDNDNNNNNIKSVVANSTHCNNNNSSNKNNDKIKNKKRCPTLAWFNFMLRK